MSAGVLALVLDRPERWDAVRAAACAVDMRFGGITVRPLALVGGSNAFPPGAAFVGALDTCPWRLLGQVFVDPHIAAADVAGLADLLEDGARVHAAPAQAALARAGPVIDPVTGIATVAPRPAPSLDAWVARRSAALGRRLAAVEVAGSAAERAARLDDLLLEGLDADADRLFGQPRRRALAIPGGTLPTGPPWPRFDVPDVPGDPAAAPVAHRGLARALGMAPDIASRVARLLGPDGAAVVEVVAGDGGLLATVLAAHLDGPGVVVRALEPTVGRLGTFVTMLRELRFAAPGRVRFRLADERAMPPPPDVLVDAAASAASRQLADRRAGLIASERVVRPAARSGGP